MVFNAFEGVEEGATGEAGGDGREIGAISEFVAQPFETLKVHFLLGLAGEDELRKSGVQSGQRLSFFELGIGEFGDGGC